jgi:hypothetical protein
MMYVTKLLFHCFAETYTSSVAAAAEGKNVKNRDLPPPFGRVFGTRKICSLYRVITKEITEIKHVLLIHGVT